MRFDTIKAAFQRAQRALLAFLHGGGYERRESPVCYVSPWRYVVISGVWSVIALTGVKE